MMSLGKTHFDAVIIGGGFYGCAISIYLAKQRGLRRVLLVERESKLLSRASYNNQARVHNGYHYPRSFTTAFRSRINLPSFVLDWPQAVKMDFTKLYAIARHNSKVTAKQFERFCREIGAEIAPAESEHRALFEPGLIESVFQVKEYVFDTNKLAEWAEVEISQNGILAQLDVSVQSVNRIANEGMEVTLQGKNGLKQTVQSRYVFNCTYSGLNQILGDFSGTWTGLKHEVTEMALIHLPPSLNGFGITVMDGPFFSMMPFPARGLHTLSHVRYTPHFNWRDKQGRNPYHQLDQYDCATRVDRMMRDVARYLPSVIKAKYVDSLFEVKTVLEKNEGDDGRPILFEKYQDLPGFYSVLGGKIDNIYDVLEKLHDEVF